MADENKKSIFSGSLKRLSDIITGNADDLYSNTYYADPSNSKQLKNIKADITSTVKDIMSTNSDNTGVPNISKLYERILLTQKTGTDTMTEFERIFGDNDFINNLTGSYLDTRWVKAVDVEIDEVLKYMPKLQEALCTIKDNVLSSDSFSKDFLNIESAIPSTRESAEQFSRNISDMKDKYDLEKVVSDAYDKTSKYGEVFIYCVPYTKAIDALMKSKQSNSGRNISIKSTFGENANIVMESSTSEFEPIRYNLTNKTDDNPINLNLHIENGLISSIIEAEYNARQKRQIVKEQSISEQYFFENGGVVNESISTLHNDGRHHSFDNTLNGNLEFDDKLPTHHRFDHTLYDDMPLPSDRETSTDGLRVTNGTDTRLKEMNGCIVKTLKREMVTPIIMNDICLGYYYFENDDTTALFEDKQPTTGMVNTITGMRSNGRSEAFDSMNRREELLRTIASNLADKIDNKFVNANQDLKKEIYYILKYNEQFNSTANNISNIKVSYIPPEDIHHIYFELDEDTGRGVSDLNMSLIPAKLWVAIYITNCLAVMTRGNDKRVYYVKQSVESNISKTMLKTINEIKKSNFGIRQIENINSVLNITGRFNDYIIPRGADGQAPIEFEVMPGQQIDIKTDLLNLLEESAINVIGIPIEIIQNRQSPDYAMQLTMSNSKFLRFVYSRQAVYQKALAPLLTKIYNVEYGANEHITVTLPPPLFINVTNTNQLIVNTSEFCENIVNIIMADEQNDVVRAKYGKELKQYYLGGYLNMDVLRKLENRARQSVVKDIVSNPENLNN